MKRTGALCPGYGISEPDQNNERAGLDLPYVGMQGQSRSKPSCTIMAKATTVCTQLREPCCFSTGSSGASGRRRGPPAPLTGPATVALGYDTAHPTRILIH